MDDEIFVIQRQIEELKGKLSEARRARPSEPVKDYEFRGPGTANTQLSEAFGEKQDLIVIHNMGKECLYCTMWADGLAGMLPQLTDRAALVVISPDTPDVQAGFAASRGWTFPMLSGQGSSFIKDMGYEPNEGDYMPGVSAFHRQTDGSIVRTGRDYFGPGDDYCPPWRFFDLLRDGANGWEPRYSY